MIFVVRVHARDHADPECAEAARHSRGCGLKCRRGQSVPDDHEFVARHSGTCEAVRRGLRIADDCIAPAKSGGLGAELRSRHQISELAMTADDDRHTRQTSGWNKGQVGVEIESMRDLDSMAPQVAAQAEACPQRLPSEKAAAERELGNVSKVFRQRAATAYTSQVRLESGGANILREDGELAF